MMNYETARDLIEDGDLISVRETHGFLTPFTRFFTRSAFTHSGIAFWMDGGLWMAELNSGRNHAIPLSQLSNVAFDVHYPPVPRRERVRAAIEDQLREKVDYSIPGMLMAGFLDWFRICVFLHARHALECSGWCVAVYEAAGWPERSRILSPADLASQLVLKLQVRPTKTEDAEASFFSTDKGQNDGG